MKPLRKRSSTWFDITRNAETGHVIALDYFKAVSFFVGIGLLIFATGANMALAAMIMFCGVQVSYQTVSVPCEPGIILLTMAFGLQNSKLVGAYFQRKTTDGNGNALATAASATASDPNAPTLMPQIPPGADTAEAPLPPTC